MLYPEKDFILAGLKGNHMNGFSKILVAIWLIAPLTCLSQTTVYPILNIEAHEGGKLLVNPFYGGLNNPQLSPINLNGDENEDLFIFDTDGNKVLTFLNFGTANEVDYRPAPEYQSTFPPLSNWTLIRDYNCDGVSDIYAHTPAGFKLFEGSMVNDSLAEFNLIDNLVKYHDGTNEINIYVANDDIPAVVDVNDDGDLDIITFSLFGSAIEYYENLAIEKTGKCDTLVFERTEDCWGNFFEASSNNSVFLNQCDSVGMTEHSLHSGSTICAFDQNRDGDKELILGDITFDNLVYVENGGDKDYAHITSFDSLFPSYNTPARVDIFPAAFYLDVNNDFKNDLVVAPHSRGPAMNQGNVWYYKNVGTTEDIFSLETDSFLVGQMIDVGEGSEVASFNYNNDSLMDLMIGNIGYYDPLDGLLHASIAIYENVGTRPYPAYKLVSKDYKGIGTQLGALALSPTFGDIDGDGDEDLLIGTDDGRLHLYLNNPVGGIDDYNLAFPIYSQIDIGQFSKPDFYDVDQDGDLDLLVGTKLGKVRYYPNIGTPTNAEFLDTFYNANFGAIDVSDQLSINEGLADPLMVYDSTDQRFEIFVGTGDGQVYQYNVDMDSLMEGSFWLQEPFFGRIDEGSYATIEIADINNDGPVEYILGNLRGGINIYSTLDWDTTSNDTIIDDAIFGAHVDADFELFPNPVTDVLMIELTENQHEIVSVELVDLRGRTVMNMPWPLGEERASISTQNVENGMYFCRLWTNIGFETKPFVVDKYTSR